MNEKDKVFTVFNQGKSRLIKVRSFLNFFVSFVAFVTFVLEVPAQIPEPVIPAGVGVNIHFVGGHEKDLDLIAAAGFKFIRMDFSWEETEAKTGVYNWADYDELSDQLASRGLRAIYILDYVNAAYEPMVDTHRPVEEPVPERHVASPRHPESVAAFARWSAAAATHFRDRKVIWEIYNEPNGQFWRPKPDVAEYTTMALATVKAIKEAEPNATVIGPALSAFDFKFLEPFLASGVLQYLDGISVHPYRQPNKPPETATRGFKEIRDMINRYAPKSRRDKIAIISGEWGYTSKNKGVSLETQGDFAVRQQLSNLLNGVPLSIWYDWKNDGTNLDDGEQNFGVVYPDLSPKPAYTAIKEMTRALDGYQLKERLSGFATKDYVLLFAKRDGSQKIAAWTLGQPHSVLIERWKPKLSVKLRSMPQYFSVK